uniref:hypothetical protein n=1 Tax=Pachymeniopsis lanceolata TaxID=151733 RepID=UPI002A840F71|nr:hypothetical protein UYL67_pgp104 [Pachymeniopsis lanceolata]WOL37234.1 hypothetical protein [Pachymeniopsis lanceolata]
MNSFWKNITKYPKFLISIITGFFLTTFYPIFKLLTTNKNRFLFIIILNLILIVLYYTVRLMLDVN